MSSARASHARPRTLHVAREEVTGLTSLAAVAAAGTAFAYAFRRASFAALELLTGEHDPTHAAARVEPRAVFVVVSAAVVVAAWVGHRVTQASPNGLGLTALASAAKTGSEAPSLRATLSRAIGTWIASFAMVSVGRESAILETAGALGANVERRTGRFRGALTAGGISAAFAAAYHAPIAAVFYVEEHVGIRRQPRAVAYTIGGALVSRLLLATLLDAEAIFPRHEGGLTGAALLGAIGIVPAAIGARVFLHVRDRTSVAARDRLPAPARVAVLALIVGTVTAVAPLTAGNGMEALRFAAEHPTIAVALALAVGKLVATTTALAAGVPGGAFSPTMALSAGSALVVYLAANAIGVPLPSQWWDGMLLAMVVGIAVGLQAPLTAAFAVPEMAGDLGLLPLSILAAAGAAGIDHLMDKGAHRRRRALVARLHDEDA